MAYASHSPSFIAAFGAAVSRAFAALADASNSIAQDRAHAVAALQSKSDDELARLGVSRARIAQDVHSHLYYS